MNVHGDYAASIIHEQRSHDLQAEARRDGLARQALAVVRRRRDRKARAVAGRRARTA